VNVEEAVPSPEESSVKVAELSDGTEELSAVSDVFSENVDELCVNVDEFSSCPSSAACACKVNQDRKELLIKYQGNIVMLGIELIIGPLIYEIDEPEYSKGMFARVGSWSVENINKTTVRNTTFIFLPIRNEFPNN
jgi:hypothetical protein